MIVKEEAQTIRCPSVDEIHRAHALAVAALGRSWAETDLIASAEVVREGLVHFVGTLEYPALTEEGAKVFAVMVAAMRDGGALG